MSAVHVFDETDGLVGCSEACDMRDLVGNPVGQGLCDCFDPLKPTLVDVPMPPVRDGWRVTFDFTPGEPT